VEERAARLPVSERVDRAVATADAVVGSALLEAIDFAAGLAMVCAAADRRLATQQAAEPHLRPSAPIQTGTAGPARPLPPGPARSAARGPTQRSEPAELRLFGGFELRLPGRQLDWSALRPPARATLRLLALHAGRPVHRQVLVEALWPDLPPQAAIRNLQVTVASLRRFLDPDSTRAASRLLIRAGDTYLLALPPGTRCDLAEFEANLHIWWTSRQTGPRQWPAGAPDTAVAAVHRALGLYRGDLLPEDGTAAWVVAERNRLRHEAAEAGAALGVTELRRGNPAAAAAALERAVRIDPAFEAGWRLLIDAYDQIGDAVAAARARNGHAQILADLAPEPHPRTTAGRTAAEELEDDLNQLFVRVRAAEQELANRTKNPGQHARERTPNWEAAEL
jgi:DNA-binding SARP family transcriptional activator